MHSRQGVSMYKVVKLTRPQSSLASPDTCSETTMEMEKRESTATELTDPEKSIADSSSSLYLTDKDEALQLVGLERAESFTEEQYRRVRRKLVSLVSY